MVRAIDLGTRANSEQVIHRSPATSDPECAAMLQRLPYVILRAADRLAKR